MAWNRLGSVSSTQGTSVETLMSRYDPVLKLPLRDLGCESLYLLSLHLDTGTHNNWRTLGELMMFDNLELSHFENEKHRTSTMIKAFAVSALQFMQSHPTVEKLIHLVHNTMRRQDVFTDEKLIQSMIRDYQREENIRNRRVPHSVFSEVGSSTVGNHFDQSVFGSFDSDSTTLTNGYGLRTPDTPYLENRGRDQRLQKLEVTSSSVQESSYPASPVFNSFDRILLSDDSDSNLVSDKIIPKVEGEWKLSFCVPQRDIPSVAVNTLRQRVNQSRKIVIVLSDELFQGRDGQWLANFILDTAQNSPQRILLIKYKPFSSQSMFDYLLCSEFSESIPENQTWNEIRENLML